MTSWMKLVEGFTILTAAYFGGELLSEVFNFPLPGNLTGLLLMFLALLTGVVKEEQIKDAANFLLDNMMLFFIPLNVGLMTIFPLLKEEGLAMLLALIISTVLVMVITAYTAEGLRRLAPEKLTSGEQEEKNERISR